MLISTTPQQTERQYLKLLGDIYHNGHDVMNERTGKVCRTIINADLEYSPSDFPLITTRKSFWKSAVAELLGYVKGFDNAADFRALGTKTWDANANKTKAWLDNPFRKGEDDMGRVYGTIGRGMRDIKIFHETSDEQIDFLQHAGYRYVGDLSELEYQEPTYKVGDEVWVREIDQLKRVIDNLSEGKDGRFEMVTFYDPTEVEFGALRPCMYSHHFSILDGTLYLHSTQRSCDVPLGLNFNMVQVYVLLAIVAKVTGLKMGKAYHKIVNAHIYEDQLPFVPLQLERDVIPCNIEFIIDDSLDSWDALMDATLDQFDVRGYKHHDPINYPFSE